MTSHVRSALWTLQNGNLEKDTLFIFGRLNSKYDNGNGRDEICMKNKNATSEMISIH